MDYPAADYRSRLDVAHAHMRDRLTELMAHKLPAVVDSAFWNRAARDDYKALVERAGCRWQLIYLQTPLELIRARLAERNQRFDANAPFPVTEDIQARFAAAFEVPIDEGAVVAVP